ncbi:unnamed protein product, partial [Polarella glacialis]
RGQTAELQKELKGRDERLQEVLAQRDTNLPSVQELQYQLHLYRDENIRQAAQLGNSCASNAMQVAKLEAGLRASLDRSSHYESRAKALDVQIAGGQPAATRSVSPPPPEIVPAGVPPPTGPPPSEADATAVAAEEMQRLQEALRLACEQRAALEAKLATNTEEPLFVKMCWADHAQVHDATLSFPKQGALCDFLEFLVLVLAADRVLFQPVGSVSIRLASVLNTDMPLAPVSEAQAKPNKATYLSTYHKIDNGLPIQLSQSEGVSHADSAALDALAAATGLFIEDVGRRAQRLAELAGRSKANLSDLQAALGVSAELSALDGGDAADLGNDEEPFCLLPNLGEAVAPALPEAGSQEEAIEGKARPHIPRFFPPLPASFLKTCFSSRPGDVTHPSPKAGAKVSPPSSGAWSSRQAALSALRELQQSDRQGSQAGGDSKDEPQRLFLEPASRLSRR